MNSEKLNEDTVEVLKDMGIKPGDAADMSDISNLVKERLDGEKLMVEKIDGRYIDVVEPVKIDPEDPVQKLASDTEDFPAMKEGGKEGPLFDIYQRTNMAEMRPYIDGEDMSDISVADVDTPGIGGMVARNPSNHDDQWYVAQEYFEDNFAPVFDEFIPEKTLQNSDASGTEKNVIDVITFGEKDLFKLISKASSNREGWMKSTKAMEIPGMGCVVQVTTQQRNIDLTYSIAEALIYVPGARILGDGKKGRQIVKL